MGKEVHVFFRAITLCSRFMVIEIVVFAFGSVESLVGTLSRHCPIHQLTPQFVLFESMWVPGWYLEWALHNPSGCDCGPTIYDLTASVFSRMSSPWLVPWVGHARSAEMCLLPPYCEHFLCESCVDFSLTKEFWLS